LKSWLYDGIFIRHYNISTNIFFYKYLFLQISFSTNIFRINYIDIKILEKTNFHSHIVICLRLFINV
ncbi:hypothetical protein, partial [Francisella tularensis]|uniref:hypothetical protein n=1 Tax=Francisella tularensis TaxID=263 RepID=UPI001F3AC9B0